MQERLQKILATAGVASRRAAEDLIRAGRVRVNGAVVTRLGTVADPDRDTILVDDRPVRPSAERTYIALHKPVGVVTTVRDPQGRPTVLDLLRQVRPAEASFAPKGGRLGVGRGGRRPPGAGRADPVGRIDPVGRLYPVGRLDRDSSGLVLLTDDGELAARLTHPRYHVEKEYLVEVQGEPPDEALARFEAGLILDDKPTAPARVWRVGSPGAGGRATGTSASRARSPARRRPAGATENEVEVRATTRLGIILREGRKRQIRRMWQVLGYPVVSLIRLRIGPLQLGRLRPGQWRVLGSSEVRRLRESVGLRAPLGDHADRH